MDRRGSAPGSTPEQGSNCFPCPARAPNKYVRQGFFECLGNVRPVVIPQRVAISNGRLACVNLCCQTILIVILLLYIVIQHPFLTDTPASLD